MRNYEIITLEGDLSKKSFHFSYQIIIELLNIAYS